MWQWSYTLSSPSGFVHIWQVVALLYDRNSEAVSSIRFGVAMYSSNNCLASYCKSRINFSAASSPLYMTRGSENFGLTLLTALYAKLHGIFASYHLYNISITFLLAVSPLILVSIKTLQYSYLSSGLKVQMRMTKSVCLCVTFYTVHWLISQGWCNIASASSSAAVKGWCSQFTERIALIVYTRLMRQLHHTIALFSSRLLVIIVSWGAWSWDGLGVFVGSYATCLNAN